MIIDKIYVSNSRPSTTNILWAKPLANEEFALYAFLNGKWSLLRTMKSGGTSSPDDDTPEELDDILGDILGIDAEGIAELKALVEDKDLLTGILPELKKKANLDSDNVFTGKATFQDKNQRYKIIIKDGEVISPALSQNLSVRLSDAELRFYNNDSSYGDCQVAVNYSSYQGNKHLSVDTKIGDTYDEETLAYLSDIPAVTPQVQSDWNETDNTKKSFINNKPDIPTKTSDLTNDSGFIDKEDIAPVEEVTKSRNDYDSSAGVISFITGDGEVYYPSVKNGTVSFYESTVDMIFSNDFISLAQYTISFIKGTASSVQIKDGDNVLYTAVPYSPGAGPVFNIKSLIKDSNGTYTAVVNNNPSRYNGTTITFTSNTLTIAPVGNPSYMTTDLRDVSGAAITYLKHTELSTLHKVAITGSYNDLKDKPNIPDVTGKADKVSNATNGNFAALDSNGNLIDSGHKHSDYLTEHQSLTNYVQKSQTTGLLKNDGTVDTNTYLTQHQDISGKADKSEMSVVPGTDTDADKTTITLKQGTSATVLTAHQDISGKADTSSLASVATSGSYNDLSNTPTIPNDASDVSYDSTHTGLSATNVQDAIDELDALIYDAGNYETVSLTIGSVDSTFSPVGQTITVTLEDGSSTDYVLTNSLVISFSVQKGIKYTISGTSTADYRVLPLSVKASIPTRYLTMRYIPIATGVFILQKDGNYYLREEYDAETMAEDAVGVLVLTSALINAGFGIVIGKNDIFVSSQVWYNGTNPKTASYSNTNTLTGYANTTSMAGKGFYPAAAYCRKQSIEITDKTLLGYLLSKGESSILISNNIEINNCLISIDGIAKDFSTNNKYYTSTDRYNAGGDWYQAVDNSGGGATVVSGNSSSGTTKLKIIPVYYYPLI